MDFIENKLAKNLIITLIVIIGLFLIGISVYLVKASSDSTCGYGFNEAIDSIDYKTNGDVITDDAIVLESINLDNKEFGYYKNYAFCVNGEVKADTALELLVYDSEGVIGSNYFSNGSGYHCVNIDKELNKKNNFIGFSCSNCDVFTNNFTPVISVGTDTLLIVDGVSTIGDQRDYAIKGFIDCDYTVFRLFKYMVLTIVLFGLIFLIGLGVDYIKKVAFSGW